MSVPTFGRAMDPVEFKHDQQHGHAEQKNDPDCLKNAG